MKSFKMKGLLLFTLAITARLTLSSEFSGGDGTSNSPYQITTLSDLKQLTTNVNNNNNKYTNTHFILTEELNLDGSNHTPIGLSPETPFCGIFDGDHKYVTSYSIENPDYVYAGFFGYLGAGAKVLDLNIGGHINIHSTGHDLYAGGVAGYATGATITGCTIQGTVAASSNKATYAGGVAGYATETTIANSHVLSSGEVASSGSEGAYAGGIVAVMARESALEGPLSGCDNEAAVRAASARGDTMAAGIAAVCGASVNECDNKGDVTAEFGERGYAAGIACYLGNADTTVAYVTNEGIVTTKPYGGGRMYDFSYSAGIAGFFEKERPTVTAAHNFGHVTANATAGLYLYAAGIAGGLEESAVVSGVRNDGNVTVIASAESPRVYATMGGLVADAEVDCLIINSHNAAPVRALSAAQYATYIMGGVAGELLSNTVVRNSFNTGDVLSEASDPLTYEYIAGIAALIGSNSTIDNCYTLAHIAWTKSASLIDLDVVGALAGSSADTYITNSYWLYSSRYKPVGRGVCDNCGSFDEYGVMIEDSDEPHFLYERLNEQIANQTDYRTWVQGHGHPAEFDCKYFNSRTDSCEAHSHCVYSSAKDDIDTCVYAPCRSFEYATCGARECARCDAQWKCMDPSEILDNSTCTMCSSFDNEADCSSIAATNGKCKWCPTNGKCVGIGFRCKAFKGNGTETDPYIIDSTEDFETIRRAVDGGVTFEHVYFKQTVDLDFGGKTLFPIGDEARHFRGTYDGQRHKIVNYVINGAYKYAGLFGYLGYEGMITNLRARGNVSTTTRDEHAYAGGIVGFAYANVINCRNFGSVTAIAKGGYAYAGGIVGYAEFGAVAKTINTGKVTAMSYSGDTNTDAYAYAGGVAGYLVSDFYLEKCFNFGEIFAGGNSSYTKLCAGGIAGYLNSNNYVVNSLNGGTITAQGDHSNPGTVRLAAGGIAGECDYSNYVMNFGNHGNISVISNLTSERTYTVSYAGGFFGSTSAGNTIENSYSTGFIFGYTSNRDDHDYSAIGGLIGIAIRGSAFRNCYFSGDVVLDTYLSNYYSYAGALIGYSAFDTIENCYWRFDPELDSFGYGYCTKCASFDKYDVVAEDGNDPQYLYQALNEYLDPAGGNHTSKLPGENFMHWVQGISSNLPSGFECSNFNTAYDFCDGAEYCKWVGTDTNANEIENEEESDSCVYRPCSDFPYESCNAAQCKACDYTRMCIDASDNSTSCIPCTENKDEYSCTAIPVCHWCVVTKSCLSDTHMCTAFSGNGTKENPYIVRSIHDLQTIQVNVNSGVNYKDRYFKLINNLYLNEMEVDPIGTASNPFRGSFDGDGHIVSGYKIEGSNHAYVGFFGYVGEGGSVHNFRVNGTLFVSSYHFDIFAGGVAGYAYRATISGCHNYGRVRSHSETGFSYAGGIVGYSDASNITSCYNTAPVTATGINTNCYAGGIVADSESDYPINHCFNDASISVAIQSRYQSSNAGGIAGTAKDIINCFNRGDIMATTSTDSFSFNGGIVGIALSLGHVYNSFNTGRIFVQTNVSFTYSYTGGIVGSTYGAEVDNCYSSGDIVDHTASATVGALVGSAYQQAEITHCYYPATLNWTATGTNVTCANCSRYFNGVLTDTNEELYVALNRPVTKENGYTTWAKPTAGHLTAAFDCDYFTSITSDACTRAKYCSWCISTNVCAPLGTCMECSELKSHFECHNHSDSCTWCEDEGLCKVRDSECIVCSSIGNASCDAYTMCHYCNGKGCVPKSTDCSNSKKDSSVTIIISVLGGIVLFIILIVVVISCITISNSRRSKDYTMVDGIEDNIGRNKAPLLINEEGARATHLPPYISQAQAFSVDRTSQPEVSVDDICAGPISASNLNAALREAGFTETQTATLMAAALDRAASAAGNGNSLTQEEAMALALLTYDAGADAMAEEENPFALINAALREGSVQSVAPVRSLVAIIIKALNNISPLTNTTVYHGVQAKASYDKNTVLNWPEFMCASSSMDDVKSAMNEDDKIVGTIFTISNARGYDLSGYSFSSDSSEVFIKPGAQLKVVDVSSSFDLNIINLEMIN